MSTKKTQKKSAKPKAESEKRKAESPPLIAKPPKSVGLVDVTKLVPNPWNGNRKADDGLLQSVRAKGVLQNLVAREVTGGKLEVVCGGRRLDAAQRTKTERVPVAIYDLSDQEAREIHIIENLQREAKGPIEEAREVGELLAMNKSPREIAAQLGRPWTWVVRRAALAKLAPEVFQALEKGKHGIRAAGVAKLELLAKYPHEVQRELLAETQDWFWADDRNALEQKLAESTKEIKLAPWAADDALLCPKAGPCNKCHKRSSYSPGLFDDDDDPAKLAAHDRCLDGYCWSAKMKTHLLRTEEQARAAHPGLVKVATDEIRWGDPLREDKSVLGKFTFEKVKEGAKGAKPALVVHGPDAGKVIHIVQRRENVGRVSDPAEKKPVKTLAEKRAALEARRIALIIEQKLKPELMESKLPKPGGDPLNATDLRFWMRLAVAFGTDDPQRLLEDTEIGWPMFKASEKDTHTSNDDLRAALWELLKDPLRGSVVFYTPSDLGEDIIAAAKDLAWLLGLKWVELLAWAVEQIKEPKAWTKEEPAKTVTDKTDKAAKKKD